MTRDEEAINRCIQIGKNGLGTSRPNPMVGAVIMHNNRIIGEGFTSSYGGAHAEVNAINSVKNKELLKDSTLYVTLEPCSHYGKTPPCSDLILSKGIPKVVIGCLDDNPQVAGNGVRRLKANGVDVSTGVLEDSCREHHKRFFTYFNKKRPYIILKWAETKDGFIAPKKRQSNNPVWITNQYSRQLVHKWRAQEHGILVGSKTVKDDNPSLNVRDWGGIDPVKIVVSNELTNTTEYKLFHGNSKTHILKGDIPTILNQLFDLDINSILVEGGAHVLYQFIEQNYWDEARVFYSNISFNHGIKAPVFERSPQKVEHIKSDVLKYYRND